MDIKWEELGFRTLKRPILLSLIGKMVPGMEAPTELPTENPVTTPEKPKTNKAATVLTNQTNAQQNGKQRTFPKTGEVSETKTVSLLGLVVVFLAGIWAKVRLKSKD